jgi:hypothetical protein
VAENFFLKSGGVASDHGAVAMTFLETRPKRLVPAGHRVDVSSRLALVSFLAGGLLFGAESVPTALPSDPADLSGRFADPPSSFRILKIIHGWPEGIGAQDQLIERLRRQGFGGVVCNVSFSDYLESERYWKSFTRAVDAAHRAGLALWLYDEKGYPSANAGGLVLRAHPEWEARGLLIADEETEGRSVSLTVPPGKLQLAAAFPVENGLVQLRKPVDLSEHVRDGSLAWEPKTGRWQVMVITENRLYEGTHAELNLAAKQPYPNLLQPEPTARFLELTHQEYAKRLGDNLGQWFIATFTDEPSLMSLFLRPMPYRALPWSPQFPADFQKRRGYALLPVLPGLVAEAGPEGRRARYDFWLTIGELVSENFFGQIQQWCAGHKILSGGHLLMEEDLLAHVALYGDFFRCLRRLDAPSIDCLTSIPAQVPWWIGRLASSAAELEGRTVTMCETSDHAQRYRPPGDTRPKQAVSEAEIRGTCNRLLVSGIHAITSYYSFADLDDAALQRLNEWVGRCSLLLQGGHQVADVAVLYPVDSLWPTFRPARHRAGDAPEALRIQNVFHAAAESLFAARRDFTFIDAQVLSTGKVREGVLEHGDLRWKVVVLPAADTLPLVAWENLLKFARSGGVVIALGALPANSETEFPSPRVRAIAAEMFGDTGGSPFLETNRGGGAGVFLPTGAESLLPLALDKLLEPDVRITEPPASLRATHRRVAGQEVYFLINDSPQPWTGRVHLAATGSGKKWMPASGQSESAPDPGDIRINLGAYDAALFHFPKGRWPARFKAASGPLPGLAVRALPDLEPLRGQGEFVQAKVTRETVPGASPRPVWRAGATLTRGQVDTFLFLRFQASGLGELDNAAAFILDTWVPEGQRAQTQILVILHEEGGADYLASSSCLLNVPGHQAAYLSANQFHLAGWAKDDNGRLDLGRVSEIRVGWGGYLGRNGERVEFSVALPQWCVFPEP